MKKLLCIFSLFCISVITFSQEIVPHIELGESRKIKLRNLPSNVETIGQDKDFLYYLHYPIDFETDRIIQRKIKDFYIVKIDKESLRQVGREEVIPENNNRKKQVYGASQIGKDLCFFSGFQNELQKKYYLLVQSINKETLKLENNERIIGEIDYSGINKYEDTFFDYKLSQDSSKVLVYYSIIDEDGWILRHGLYVYDNAFQLLWQKDRLTTSEDGEVIDYRDFSIDNNGNVYVITRKFVNKAQYNLCPSFSTQSGFFNTQYYFDLPNYKTDIIRISNQGKTIHTLDVDISNKFIRSIGIGVNNQGSVFCGGLYTDSDMISPYGVFMFELDIDSGEKINFGLQKTSIEENDTSLNGETLRCFRESIGDFREWDPYDYLVSDVLFDATGNPYFVAEQKIKAKLFTNEAIFTFPVYGDLLVVKSNNNCHIDVVSRIKKRQYGMRPSPFIFTQMSPHMSYLLMEFEGRLAFVFRDYYLSARLSVRVDEGQECLVLLQENGEQVMHVLQDDDCKNCPNVMTETAIETSKNELIFHSFSINRRRYSINKLIWK